MAAFLENVGFGNFGLNLQNLLSVERSDDPQKILISHSSQGIILFSKNLHHLLQQWNVKHGSRVTSPAVFSHFLNQYIAVLNDKVLWQLPCMSERSDVESTQKIYGSAAAYRVIPRKYDEPLIVLKNGEICLLKDFKNVKASENDAKDIILCEFVEDALTKDTTVYLLYAESDNLVMTSRSVIGTDMKDKISAELPKPDYQSCSFCPVSKQVIFLSQTGEVSSWSINSSSHVVKKLFDVTSTSKDSIIRVLSNSYLAVTDIRDSKTAGIAIFCLRFGTRQAWVQTPNVQKVYVNDREIYLLTSSSIQMLGYDCSPSTLAAAFGKGVQDDSLKKLSSKIPSDHWKIMKNMSTDKDKDNPVDDLLSKLSNPAVTKDAKSFHKALKELVSVIDEKLVHVISGCFLTVWKRCLSEKKLWSSSELMPLIKMKLVPIVIYKELFDHFISRDDVILLCTALQSLPNIPESIMVKTLEYFISYEESIFNNSQLSNLIGKRKCDNCQPFGKNQAGLINTLIFLPYNDVFLQDNLATLKFDNALKLLKYLYNQLLYGISSEKDSNQAPIMLLQIVDWLTMVLDGHFTQLILSEDSREILKELDNLIKQQTQFYEELLSLEVLLTQLRSKAAIPQKQCSGLYNIHVLHVY